MQQHQGIAASPGIGIGTSFCYTHAKFKLKDSFTHDIIQELALLEQTLNEVRKDIEQSILEIKEKIGDKEASIFEAHLLFMEDPEIVEMLTQEIYSGKNAFNAVFLTFDELITRFQKMESEYMRERAKDLEDIKNRILMKLEGKTSIDLHHLPENTILIADDLLPSDTIMLNPVNVKGFITSKGGRTGHIAIMARTLGIPAIVGVYDLPLRSGLDVVMDGESGLFVFSPDEETRDQFDRRYQKYQRDQLRRSRFAHMRSVTASGNPMDIAANIATPEDIERILSVGAEGIGLFRTEFLFMDRSLPPSEEEQYKAYAGALCSFPTYRTVIRTLDIGGDKDIPYMNFPQELNPFLGYRAIRYCLAHESLLKTQFRALLRASVHGKLAVMLPMISTLDEVLAAKRIFRIAQEELSSENISYCDQAELGIMIETPHAAILSDVFAKHVDFFSIGTNDLIQYTLAADRSNPHLADLYHYYHPGVLRLIIQVIQNAKSEGIWVGMCGEAACDPLLLPLWVHLGIDELSMSSSSILQIRELLSRIDERDLICLSQEMQRASDASEVKQILDKTSSFFKIC